MRTCVPSARSMPDMRVWAVNGTKVAPALISAASSGTSSVMPSATAKSMIERPSGVRSASEAMRAAATSSWRSTPSSGYTSEARRLPYVMVPVLSSSRVLTSPAASTARPDIASTLRCTSRSMPAMPIADSSAPIVVGMRQTSSATSTTSDSRWPEKIACGCSAITASRKMIVSVTSRMPSAISFGVF